VELVEQAQGERLPTSFGASLRAARLTRNVTLDTVATRTKLNRTFFQDLERDDLSKWPASQFYRESSLRAYCKAVGLDAREVIGAFRQELAAAAASSTASPAKPRRLTPVTIPIILATTFVVFYALARWAGPSLQKPEKSVEPHRNAAVSVAPTVAEASPRNDVAPKPAVEVRSKPAVETPATRVPSSSPSAAAVAAPDPKPAADPAPALEGEATAATSKPVEGELMITSTPTGATVLVNGINRGVTPVRVQFLPPGSYTIRLIYRGHASVNERATISPSRLNVQISATLEPLAGQN